MMIKNFLLAISVTTSFLISAQEASVDIFGSEKTHWQHKDLQLDKTPGIGTERAYEEILKGKEIKKEIVVAVIDNGVDIDHEDLKGKIWINKGEIPNNGIDDDNNGYIDDIHGWNFLGNANGENIHAENLEMTRIVKQGVSHPDYAKAKEAYDKALKQNKEELESYNKLLASIDSAKVRIKRATGIEVNSKEDLKKVDKKLLDDKTKKGRKLLSRLYLFGIDDAELLSYKDYYEGFTMHYLNTDFNPREKVGDDPHNINDKAYGNPDVKGPSADHGTGVAGLIAANRDNNIGIKGIASNVKIMALRAVPNGDERDKDIALAIRYAVDNGAQIINCSFGKAYSTHTKWVHEAIIYAEENNVLIVQASGNDGKNVDENISFPNDNITDEKYASNVINVGASTMHKGKKIPASFSNYGITNVDLFAPGQEIICLDTSSTYSQLDGTSFASPITAGVAALVLSYYPDLKPHELKAILMESSTKKYFKKKVIQPREGGKKEKVKFYTLSQSGGIVNVYEALKLADSKS